MKTRKELNLIKLIGKKIICPTCKKAYSNTEGSFSYKLDEKENRLYLWFECPLCNQEYRVDDLEKVKEIGIEE